MALGMVALTWNANDPMKVARHWAEVLDWPAVADRSGGVALLPTDDTGFRIRYVPSPEPKVVANRVHFDLTSQSYEEQQATVERALAAGGRHIDIGQLPEEEHVVLADPEGNEFCVIEPGNNFLAECGMIGALAGDGSQAVGYFWSAALDWPLVWDQDEETAIRSPRGGPKFTWGGPPVEPKIGVNRLHFDLAPTPGGDEPADLEAEVDRLISLGASRTDLDPQQSSADVERVTMLDPDGNEFCVWASVEAIERLPQVAGSAR